MDVPGTMGVALSMSEINKKLNALSQQHSNRSSTSLPLQAAVVKPVPQNNGPRWMIAGLCIAVVTGGMGWWLGSQSQLSNPKEEVVSVESATAKPAPELNPVAVAMVVEPDIEFDAGLEAVPETVPEASRQPIAVSKAKNIEIQPTSSNSEVKPKIAKPNTPKPVTKQAVSVKSEVKPPVIAVKPPVPEVNKTPKQENLNAQSAEHDEDRSAEELTIETVELDAAQLANVEYKKAQKALKSGDSRKAIGYLRQTLKYQPEWVKARQKLSALYYGRGETRKAVATLQDGLKLDGEQPDLRLTMARLLVNESQQQAALNVLSRLPEKSHSGYLAMRGALAQQLNNNELAMSSYKLLVKEEPYDGRWWLGLGIALERSEVAEKALDAYKQALLMGRISQQSQKFIQQRLALLEAREG